MKNKLKILIFLLVISLVFPSCSSLLKGLTDALYQQNDIQLVEDGAPSYLLLVEGLIKSNPKNKDFLVMGIQMFSAYSGAFVKDPERSKIFLNKSKNWALALLRSYSNFNKAEKGDFDNYNKEIQKFNKKDVPYIFWAANAWIMWIINNSDSLEALMDLPKAKALIDRVNQLDDSYYYGAPHLFYGMFYSFLAESLGGNLTEAKKHFDIALKYSDEKFLMTKVYYALFYLKAKYDKENFIKILEEVVNTDLDKYPELRLLNTLSQNQAKDILKNIDKYFY